MNNVLEMPSGNTMPARREKTAGKKTILKKSGIPEMARKRFMRMLCRSAQ